MVDKILYVVRPARGGIKKHLVTLLEGIDRGRYLCYLACPRDGGLMEDLSPLVDALFPVPIGEGFHPRRDLKAIVSLAAIIRREGINLVHCHGIRAALPGAAAAVLRRTPVIATIHNLQDTDTRYFTIMTWLARRLFNLGRVNLIAVSQAVRDELIHYRLVSPDRVRVIYNGIDLEAGESLTASGPSRRSLGLSPGIPLVGVVARLEPRKGVLTLIKAIGLLKRSGDQVHLAVVGDGPLRASLEAETAGEGIREQVTFLGFRDDVSQLLPLFDLVAVPSLKEGLSIISIEALTAGSPVVASRVGGLPEIVRDGETGLLVPPEDPPALAAAIHRLLIDRELARSLATAGRKLVAECFDRRIMWRQTAALYEEVLGAAGRERQSV